MCVKKTPGASERSASEDSKVPAQGSHREAVYCPGTTPPLGVFSITSTQSPSDGGVNCFDPTVSYVPPGDALPERGSNHHALAWPFASADMFTVTVRAVGM